eukprot:TRINITY_DN1414_c0_g1_i4.p1 TRINITY_DN1414_c0_g1~~TRINITY_DN1414_c0_g1_i4.p1  ORF type:complete len:403 (-),score=119.79 TRINITY_DN1414_c0_g1_i4:655-1863(-)
MAPTAAFAWTAPLRLRVAVPAVRAVCRPAGSAAASWVRPAGRRVAAAVRPAAPTHIAPSPRRVVITASATSSTEAPRAPEPSGLWSTYVKVSTLITNLFPLWTALCALLALAKPAAFTWLTTPYFTASLGLLMLSMGITLTVEDFSACAHSFWRRRHRLSRLLRPDARARARAFQGVWPAGRLCAGLVLVGAVNGGQASNLATFIAKGDVALSVVMTTATTLGAIVMTPLLSQLLIGAVVPVNALGIATSTIQVVLFPIALGMALNRYANRLVRSVLPFSPVIGVLATCLLVGSSVAQCAAPILAAGWALQLPIMLLHLIGGVAGYYLPAFAGYGEVVRRTTAIETSMKSSAFGFLLASLHFANFAARVPAAVSVVWMAVIGSTMAVVWRYIPVPKDQKTRA